MPSVFASPNSLRMVEVMSYSWGSVARILRLLNNTPGTWSAAMQWSPIQACVLSSITLFGTANNHSWDAGAAGVRENHGYLARKRVAFGAGDRVLALSDKGELVLFSASPDAYKELARADVLDGKCWSTPTLAGGRIFARSTTHAAAFEIAK